MFFYFIKKFIIVADFYKTLLSKDGLDINKMQNQIKLIIEILKIYLSLNSTYFN